MRSNYFPTLLLMLALSCARQTDPEDPIGGAKKASGDLGQFILKNILDYGGTPIVTNALQPLAGEWWFKTDSNGVQINLAAGDHPKVAAFLALALGAPDPDKGSRPLDKIKPSGHKGGWYHARQAGVSIQVTEDGTRTSIIILRAGASVFGSSKIKTP